MYVFIANKIVYLHSRTIYLNHKAKEHKIMEKLEKYVSVPSIYLTSTVQQKQFLNTHVDQIPA
jgi:hypothetical protein